MKGGEDFSLDPVTASLSEVSQSVHAGLPLHGPSGGGPSPAEAAKEFEAYVLRLILAQMRRTVGSGGFLSGSGTQTYQAMFEEALARRASEAGTFGLARELLQQWGEQP
jgi:hypothetical protein